MTIISRRLAWVIPATLGIAAVTTPVITTPIFAAEPPTPATNSGSSSKEVLNQLAEYNRGKVDTDPLMSQVTSVSQLSDVKPTDWAFQALQSLVERYGCIVGYPDRTYRGNRPTSRYEFAAGLNACLNRISELLASSTADLVKKEDLEALQRLQEEFAAELAGLRGRVESLEVRTATLEKQQFSTTTKLQGEAIFNIADVFGGDRALNSDNWRTINVQPTAIGRANVRDALLTNRSFVSTTTGAVGAATTAAVGTAGTGANPGRVAFPTRSRDITANTIFSDRVRVNLVTSFTGRDTLYTRLEANNTTAFNTAVTGTNQTRLGYDTTVNVDNSIQLGKAFYRFPIGDSLNIIVDAIGGEFFSNFNTFNPYFENPATGAVSRFGRFSPIYRTSNTGSGQNTGSGISANLKLGNLFTLSAGYLARQAFDPTSKKGLADGTYAALAQLAFQPSKDFGIALTYAHAYYSGANNDVAVSGAYGTGFANQPFGAAVATSANNFGVEASFRVAPWLTVSGWGLYTQAIAENGRGVAAVNTGDKADIWSWAVSLAFPDLLKKGNVGGIIFGRTPSVTGTDYGLPLFLSTTAANPAPARRFDGDTSYHLEALYLFQVTRNISITPAVFVIFNPEGNSNNSTQYVGVLRTTFRF